MIKDLPIDAVYDEMNSPIGRLMIITSPMGLHAILWDIEIKRKYIQTLLHGMKQFRKEEIMATSKKQLSEYFAKKRTKFTLPLALSGTDFQIQAWQQLMRIPYGETISYGEQAKRIGDINKARAVGMANKQNPIPIVIPCHRVIGSNGKLVGFAGGLERKSYLLQHENF